MKDQTSDKGILTGVENNFQNVDTQPIDVEEILNEVCQNVPIVCGHFVATHHYTYISYQHFLWIKY